jgi:hypothetical protein
MALGGLVGVAVSVTLAWPGLIPKAIADEQPMKLLTASKNELLEMLNGPAEFFKPQWTVEDSVSTEVVSSSRIRKIEAGRTSFVTVARTATGVYSSDGLTSTNVRYPGIHSDEQRNAALAYLVGGGWMFFAPAAAGSSLEVIETETGGAIMSGGSTCHVVDGNIYC